MVYFEVFDGLCLTLDYFFLDLSPDLPFQPKSNSSLHYIIYIVKSRAVDQSTEVRFDSFLFGGFITAIVVNIPERKLAKRTSVQSTEVLFVSFFFPVDLLLP